MDEPVEEKSYNENLEKRLRQLNKRTLGEDAPEAVDWIQLVQFELNGLGVEREPDLKEIDRQTDQHDRKHDGKGGLGEHNNDANKDVNDVLGIDALVQIREHIRGIGCNRKIDGVPQELQCKEPHEQYERRIQLLAASDLPLLSRVGSFFRRRLFRLFPACETLEVKDERRPIGGRVSQVIYFHTFH